MWVAIQRSVGEASSVAAKYVPAVYGAEARLVGAHDAVGVPLDTDDPRRQPGRDVRRPGAAGAAGVGLPGEVTVHRAGQVGQLGRERVVDRGVVERTALLGVRLVGQVGTLHEVERGVLVRLVVGRELVVERRRVQRVDADHPDAEVAHLVEPARVVVGGDGADLAGLVQRRAAAEVDPGQEGLVAGGGVQPEAVLVGGRQHAEPADLLGCRGPVRARLPLLLPGRLVTAAGEGRCGEESETGQSGRCPSEHAASVGVGLARTGRIGRAVADLWPSPRGVPQRTRSTDLPSVRRSSMSTSACPISVRSYVAPIGGRMAPEVIRGSRASHCSPM